MLAWTYLTTTDDPTAQRAVRLIVGEAMRRPDVASVLFKGGPARLLDFLQTYLLHQIQRGTLRPHDLRASARLFLGMLAPQAVGKMFLPELLVDGLGDEEHIAASVDILLRGLRPD